MAAALGDYDGSLFAAPTILLQENVRPKVVSEQLGHSSIAFIMTVYQHVMPGMQAEAAATFGAAVFGADHR